ncbi:MAG: M20 family metallopeptidase [Actinobacteria bacterium]|nr:M20 family metallopeptidase [Actinomycetota bacterium]
MSASEPAKGDARAAVEAARDRLIDLSHRIHANPELGYEEELASAWTADELERGGFRVERGFGDLPTAFVARAGSGPLEVAICAEYDALPAIGHACGHNVIAAAAVGAGLGLAAVADRVGLAVRVVGTPAEEGGGGKVVLLDRGAFDGVHAAMMVHPAPVDAHRPPIIAVFHFEVRYRGKEAHAAAFPERGVNAADGLVVAQTAIGLLRQHLRPGDRVHGIVTKGGDAPNVVPADARADYMVRASTLQELEDVKARVLRCFEAGALATGAELEVEEKGCVYAEMRHDPDLSSLYRRNAEALGRVFPDLGPEAGRAAISTDMGNVSQVIPSIHPNIGIESLPAVNHQPGFTEHCASPAADRAVVDGAVALAWTAIDAAGDGEFRERLLARPHARRPGS